MQLQLGPFEVVGHAIRSSSKRTPADHSYRANASIAACVRSSIIAAYSGVAPCAPTLSGVQSGGGCVRRLKRFGDDQNAGEAADEATKEALDPEPAPPRHPFADGQRSKGEQFSMCPSRRRRTTPGRAIQSRPRRFRKQRACAISAATAADGTAEGGTSDVGMPRSLRRLATKLAKDEQKRCINVLRLEPVQELSNTEFEHPLCRIKIRDECVFRGGADAAFPSRIPTETATPILEIK